MADFILNEVTVTCKGEPGVIADLSAALKAGETNAVKKVKRYVNLYENKINYAPDQVEIYISIYQPDVPLPCCFKPLTQDFPGIVFIFDIKHQATVSDCWGNGRYYGIYEKGELVYNASSWRAQRSFFNTWLKILGLSGDFSAMDEEQMKETIAKMVFKVQGKKITPKAVEKYIDEQLEYCSGSTDDDFYQDNIDLLRIEGKNFYEWAYDLETRGYDDYCILKAEGDLPSLNAKSYWNKFFDLDDYKE